LRLLPAMFGCLFLSLTYCWSRRLAVPRPVAIAMTLLFLLSQNVPYFFFELRAYSMELCGVVALWLATVALLERPAPLTAITWIATDWFFLSSRYSFIVYSAAACGILLWHGIKQARNRPVIFAVLAASAFWCLVLYFGMLRYQSAGGVPPDYVAQLMIAGHWGNFPSILLRALFHPAAIPATAFLAILILNRFFRRSPGDTDSPSPQPWLLNGLAAYILLANLEWMILSALGKLPWDISKRWGLSEYGLSALAMPVLYSLICLWLKNNPGRRLGRATMALLCAASLAAGVISLYVVTRRFDRENIVSEHLIPAMGALNCGDAPITVLLDDTLWPDYRYLTERSGLAIPCASQARIERIHIQDAASYAVMGLSRKRPVAYLFGSWDARLKAGVRQRLQGQNGLRVESFGPSDFTTVVTLK
jgi:hypothetical protein